MISRKLLHSTLNKLQAIMGYIDLVEIETDAASRTLLFDKARDEIRMLTKLLEERVRTIDTITWKKKK